MLKRINKLLNFGKFLDVRNIAGIQFCKYNFIFGRNTFGKSTFVSIFRSLAQNNNNLILGRKSFGKTGVQIDLEFEENNQTSMFLIMGNGIKQIQTLKSLIQILYSKMF